MSRANTSTLDLLNKNGALHHVTHRLVLLVHIAGLGKLDVSCAQLSRGRELDSVLGAGDHDGVADLGQVAADASKLPRGHLDHAAVLLLL